MWFDADDEEESSGFANSAQVGGFVFIGALLFCVAVVLYLSIWP